MATHYVDSNATGLNDGTSWADAWTSISSATGVAAGDEVLLASDHSETATSNLVLDFSNSGPADPIKLISTNKSSGDYANGATITDNGAGYRIYFQGTLRVIGLHLLFGLGFDATSPDGSDFLFDDCLFESSGASNMTSRLFVGTNNTISKATFKDCTIDWTSGSNNQCFQVERDLSSLELINCRIIPNAAQSRVLKAERSFSGTIVFKNCDLNDFPGDSVEIGSDTSAKIIFRECDVPVSWTNSGSNFCTFGVYGGYEIWNSANAPISTNPLGLVFLENFYGSARHTTSVYRTGGADDGEQVNAYSLEMTTNANAVEIYNPLEITLGSRWIAPDASPSGATAQAIFTSTRCEPLATPTALATDSVSTWNGSGVGAKQKIEHTLNNGRKLTVFVASAATLTNAEFWVEVSEPDQVGGLVTVKAFLAKPSTTAYVDPLLEII